MKTLPPRPLGPPGSAASSGAREVRAFLLQFGIILSRAGSAVIVLLTTMFISTALAGSEGQTQAEAGQWDVALPKLRQELAVSPNDPDLLYWSGSAAYSTGDFALAASFWTRLLALEPDGLRAKIKLVQAYQGLGNIPARVRARETLFTTRARVSPTTANYVRDHVWLPPYNVVVYENFEPANANGIWLYFQVYEGDTKPGWHVELHVASPGAQTLAETEGGVQAGQTLYFIDWIQGPAQTLVGCATGDTAYDDIRSTVVGWISTKYGVHEQAIGHP